MIEYRRLAGLLVALVPAIGWANALTEAHTRAYGPQTVVRVSRPTLRWEVWPGEGSRVTDVAMSLNGRQVSPRYDAIGRALVYTPSEPLAPGKYRVGARVVVDRRLPVERSWEFKVAEGAIHAIPRPSKDQFQGIDEINRIRTTLGLPRFEINANLCAAALGHSKYLDENGLTGHYQREGDPAFCGKSPTDRLDSFGYSGGSWEGVDFGADTMAESVQRLFDAPYHRIPFLQPGETVAGIGRAGRHTTIEFGMADQTGVVVSPAAEQRDVPTGWANFEHPNPLRMHSAKGPLGYPIVFAYFTPVNEKLRVERAELRTVLGQKVTAYVNTPVNDDHLENAVIIIPSKPLEPNVGYVASVNARTAAGRDVSRTWRFVTAK